MAIATTPNDNALVEDKKELDSPTPENQQTFGNVHIIKCPHYLDIPCRTNPICSRSTRRSEHIEALKMSAFRESILNKY